MTTRAGANPFSFVQAHSVLAEQWLADIAYASPKADPVRTLHADLCAWLTRLHTYQHGPAPPFLPLPTLPTLPTHHPSERTPSYALRPSHPPRQAGSTRPQPLHS